MLLSSFKETIWSKVGIPQNTKYNGETWQRYRNLYKIHTHRFWNFSLVRICSCEVSKSQTDFSGQKQTGDKELKEILVTLWEASCMNMVTDRL